MQLTVLQRRRRRRSSILCQAGSVLRTTCGALRAYRISCLRARACLAHECVDAQRAARRASGLRDRLLPHERSCDGPRAGHRGKERGGGPRLRLGLGSRCSGARRGHEPLALFRLLLLTSLHGGSGLRSRLVDPRRWRLKRPRCRDRALRRQYARATLRSHPAEMGFSPLVRWPAIRPLTPVERAALAHRALAAHTVSRDDDDALRDCVDVRE